MEKPPYLKKGDKVVIIATARKISLPEIQMALDELKSWGLEVILGKNLFKTNNQFAGTIQERLSDLQMALSDKSIKAIFCARGGYGTVQLIDKLDFTEFIKTPKWLIGYSDVTVLHNHINQKYNIATLHATMPISFANNTKESILSLKNALFGVNLSYQFPSHLLNRIGEGKGILVGGNLSIIYSLTGTNSQLNTNNKILFIEDVDEYLYHIDRMMQNLKRAGMLTNLAGLVVGGMTDMHDNTISYGKNAAEIILDNVKEYNYPVCFNFLAGHGKNNNALPMGVEVKLLVKDAKCELVF